MVTLCGVLMHSSLAVTLGGTPLGLTGAKFWTRTKFKGTWTLKGHAGTDRDEGKLSLAGEPAPVDGARGHAGTLRACGRPRE